MSRDDERARFAFAVLQQYDAARADEPQDPSWEEMAETRARFAALLAAMPHATVEGEYQRMVFALADATMVRGAARTVALTFHASLGRLTPQEVDALDVGGLGALYAALVHLSVALIQTERDENPSKGDVCPTCNLPR